MSPPSVRKGAAIFFILFALAVTWPGMIPFNRIEPLVLGLPFSMFWIAIWILLSFFVLLVVDRAEGKREEEGGRMAAGNEDGLETKKSQEPSMGVGE